MICAQGERPGSPFSVFKENATPNEIQYQTTQLRTLSEESEEANGVWTWHPNELQYQTIRLITLSEESDKANGISTDMHLRAS